MDIGVDSFGDDYFHQEPSGMTSKGDAATVPPKRKVNIYKPANSGTELHRAIRSGVESKIESVFNIYLEDFEKVKNYLVSKYQWNPDDKIWLRKTILVATGIEQCQLAKNLSRNSVPAENLDQAVFILLLYPVNGESVAVIHPDKSNQLKVLRVLRTLLPNGFLSWNCTALDDGQETFVETAASCGRSDIITRLLELGAELGPPGHNPLLTACQHNQIDTIRWLLDEHFADFNCTARDATLKNAFIIAMQKNDLEILDFVLKKMIAYRQKYFGESEQEAFSSIFRYENEQWSSFSSLTYAMTEPVAEKVGDYVAQYKLDLSYQWKDMTILSQLLDRKTALEYCYSEIRNNPKLLEMIVYDEDKVTILHECIRCGALDILKEMYKLHPEVRKIFETDHAFDQLRRELWNGQHQAVRFILDHHKDYLVGKFDKLKDDVIFCEWLEASYYETNAELLSEYFPELRQDLENGKKRKSDYYPSHDFKQAFKNCNIKFGESAIELEDPQQSLSNIRGVNGATLLHYAVDKSDQKLFTKLLEAGCNIDALDYNENHPIHYVKRVEMLDYLIGNHPQGQSLVKLQNSAGRNVLHMACGLHGERIVDLVERIIECGVDVNQLNKNGESVVHETVNVDVLKLLLKHNVNLEVVDALDQTAIQHHLERRNIGMSNYLFPLVHKLPSFREHAHKCLEPFLDGSRDLFNSSYQHLLEENPETTRLIFDSVYNHLKEEASRLFNKACTSAHSFIAQKFLDFHYDLDFNYRDEYGNTAIVGLFYYVEEDNLNLVKQLLQKGVDLEIPNQWGTNALLALACRFPTAKWYGRKDEAIQLLLDHGAKISASDDAGNSALHLAFKNNDYMLVEFLISKGADLTVKNKAGKIPVEMGSCVNKEIFYFLS